MHRRPLAGALLLGALAGLPAVPADAAPKPVAGRYTTGVALPDPTTGGTPNDTCDGLPTSRHRRAVVLPAAGTLRVQLDSVGDWGLAVRTPGNRALGRADSAVLGEPERLVVKVRARTRVLVDACNFAGAPTAQVSYRFTPSR